MPGEHLDLSSDPNPRPPFHGGERRRFLGIHFACCDVYTRIYVNHGETAYQGHCPKCSRPVRITIGPGGSGHRFFTAH